MGINSRLFVFFLGFRFAFWEYGGFNFLFSSLGLYFLNCRNDLL